MAAAPADIEELLRQRHRIAPGAPSDFRIRNQKEILDTMNGLGGAVAIHRIPNEIPHAIPFDQDREHASYDAAAVERAAGNAAVVILVADRHPALGALAGDIGRTGLVLGVERVEVLVESLFGRFAGVDGAADPWFAHGHADRFKPKNRGPDQRAPVMARAIGDSEV